MTTNGSIHISYKQLGVILVVMSILQIAGTWIIPICAKRADIESRVLVLETRQKQNFGEHEPIINTMTILTKDNKDAHEKIMQELGDLNKETSNLAGQVQQMNNNLYPNKTSYIEKNNKIQ
jgi:hypothetical protein